MYTQKDLFKHLEQCNLDYSGTLLIHSSMKSIGEVDGGADTVLDLFTDVMNDGLLLFPTHTWASVNANEPYFNVNQSSVCTGILPELFRQRSNVFRSWHPTHSVGALGQDAQQFIANQHLFNTPCHRQSVWGKLLDREATILLIGVDQTKNTYIHGIEEWHNIDNRLTQQTELLYTIAPDGEVYESPQYRHLPTSISMRYGRVEALLEESGAITRVQFGDALSWKCDVVKLTEVISKQLTINPHLFDEDV